MTAPAIPLQHTLRVSREAVMRCALALVLAERSVGSGQSVLRVGKAERELDAAAENLAAVVRRAREMRTTGPAGDL